MSDEETKVKHSKRIHKTQSHDLYEEKNDIKHSHHTHNPRKLIKQETIQEKRLKQLKAEDI